MAKNNNLTHQHQLNNRKELMHMHNQHKHQLIIIVTIVAIIALLGTLQAKTNCAVHLIDSVSRIYKSATTSDASSKSFLTYNNTPTSYKSSYGGGTPTNYKSSYGGDVHVKGHYRRTKSGKTVYVKPHTRRSSRRR